MQSATTSPSVLDTEFRSRVLDNGLQVIAEIQPAARTCAIGYFVATGGRDELPGELGVSHFLEHMLFKASASGRTALEINRGLDELGGHANAYTCEDHTVYHSTVLPKYQSRLVELLSDMMRPALLAEDFDTERQVILEEIARSDDAPPFGAYERVMETYFCGHPLGGRVLGTAESIRAMTPDVMRRYFARRYGPQTIVLAAAGRVDFEDLCRQAERLTAKWPAVRLLDRRPPDHRLPRERDVLLPIPDSQQAYVIRASSTASARDPDRYAARLLATVMGDDSGSRLFWELVDPGRAEAATLWAHEFDDSGVLLTYLVCTPEDVDENLGIVDQVLATANKPLDEAELRRAIKKNCASLSLAAERPGNRLFSIGQDWLTHGCYIPLDELLSHYRRVTPDDLLAILSRHPLEPTCTVRTVPATPEA
jgi:predicted Zn-dependent peptidase